MKLLTRDVCMLRGGRPSLPSLSFLSPRLSTPFFMLGRAHQSITQTLWGIIIVIWRCVYEKRDRYEDFLASRQIFGEFD